MRDIVFKTGMAFSFVYVLLFFVCDSCEIYPHSLASTSHLFPICICVEFSELSPLRPLDLAFLVMVALGGSGGGMRVERGGGEGLGCAVTLVLCSVVGLVSFSPPESESFCINLAFAGIVLFLFRSNIA